MYTIIKRTIISEIIPVTVFIGALLISTVITRYILLPIWLRGAVVRQEVARYKTLINGTTEYDALKSEIREKHKKLEQKHTEITEGLADPHDLSSLLQMIFDKAWEADIRFDRTIPQDEIRGSDYIHYPVLLEMNTNYNSLGKFISSLERIPQIVSIERLAMTAKNGTSINARILITCFLNLKE